MKFNIGTKINSIRTKKNFSQQEMAELLSMSPSAFSRLERNETQVSLEEIPRFAEKLQVPVQELLPEMFTVNNQPTLHSNGVVFCTNFYNFSNSKLDNDEIELTIRELESKLEVFKKMRQPG